MEMLTLIQKEVRARERKNKAKSVACILQRKYTCLKDIKLELLEQIITESHSLDREWRQILEKNPSLRGFDYNNKEIVIRAVQKQLGYK